MVIVGLSYQNLELMSVHFLKAGPGDGPSAVIYKPQIKFDSLGKVGGGAEKKFKQAGPSGGEVFLQRWQGWETGLT